MFRKTLFTLLVLLSTLAGRQPLYAQESAPTNVYLPLVATAQGPVVGTGIANGDFEAGRTAWTEIPNGGIVGLIREISPSAFTQPHSGRWLAFLGGDYDQTDAIEQAIIVPASASKLIYWHHISSSDSCNGPDKGTVLINGVALVTRDLCAGKQTNGWELQTLDLSAHAGQTITLRFEVVSDSNFPSRLYIDDVGFAAP